MKTMKREHDPDSAKNKKLKPMSLQNFVLKQNYNKAITDILSQLETIERNRKEPYKAKAYQKAVNSLQHADHEITSGREAESLEGVGPKIARKIQEIIDNGKLNKLVVELMDPVVIATNDLCRVSGIGPSYAKELVESGITGIDDLRKKKPKLNHQQEIGLKYLEEFEQRIPRAEISLFEKLIIESIHSLDKNIDAIIAGSYRRETKMSGDIDVIITQKKSSSITRDDYTMIKHVVDQLTADGLITDTISCGSKKFMGVTRLPESCQEFKPHLHRRLDVTFICYDQYYTGILHATGSDFFNAQLRSWAISKGFKLSEFFLQRQGDSTPLKIESEKDIFDKLGVPYLEPKHRSL